MMRKCPTRNGPKWFAVMLAVALSFGLGQAHAAFFAFSSEAAWLEKASEFGKEVDLAQDFDALGSGVFDIEYGADPAGVEAGFLTVRKVGSPLADGTYIIDVGLPRFPSTVNAIDNTSFAIMHASPGDNSSAFDFPGRGVAAIGFDLGRSTLSGPARVTTSLGDEVQFDISNAQTGFLGLVYDEGELMTSITFGSIINAQVVFGVDNVEAFSAVVPIPGAGVLLASGLALLAWRRRR